ncbi:sulfite exporter TauE/SafE family protein [Gulosibacter chungangensis]|uniref:Probable membrane transporter protein n=1 Tax=Gulosibacter chungangensis TaxID=979746 RepID=A0A7J5BBC5_9MICO|nr:sulfite exporter TauE/SafE family protein [Gulosibacter chungangensis]KAB1643404.1 sulfite exporter TauE/SafE family protein [Gulosibacter chungangensis]
METFLPSLPTVSWVLLLIASFFVGVSKTALPGINTISIAIFAAIMPAKESTGALLVLLIVGDIFALLSYRRHADLRALVKLIPAVALGLILGAVFLWLADNGSVQRVIGIILLLVVAVTMWQRYRKKDAQPSKSSASIARYGYGTLGGFTTMVANAGGPVMSLYFLASRFSVKTFLGTAAWFFAIVNVAKLPFSIGLGLITPSGLALDLCLVPALIVGAFVGRAIANRIKQNVFEVVVLVLTVVGAVYLLF